MNTSFPGFSSMTRARGKLVAALACGVTCAAFTLDAHAYFDDCPADQTVTSRSGEFSFASTDGKYASRPTCPFYLIDVTGAASKDLTFEALWGPAGVLPLSSQAECESAAVSWAVSQHVGGIEYSVVGRGDARGQWVVRSSGAVCLSRPTSGPSELFIANAPGSTYRLLLAASLGGVPAVVSANVTVDR